MASENSTAKTDTGKARISSLGRQKPAGGEAGVWTKPAGANGLVQFTFDNMPNSFRCWDERDVNEGNLALAWFLREAVCGLVSRIFDEEDFPNHNGGELVVKGMGMAFDLLIDRLDMASGRSPMPFLRNVPTGCETEEEEEELPDNPPPGWKEWQATLKAKGMAGAD